MDKSKKSKLIDESLPEVDYNISEQNDVSREAKFPQFEEFLKRTKARAKEASTEKYKQRLEDNRFRDNERVLPRSQSTSFEKTLKALGVSPEYLNKLHYETKNPEPVGPREMETVLSDEYLRLKAPHVRQNLKVSPDLTSMTEYGLNLPENKPFVEENLQYTKQHAKDIVGIDPGEVRIDPNLAIVERAAGVYSPQEDSIRIDPMSLMPERFSTLPHEVMHKKDAQDKNTNFGNEDLDLDFRNFPKASTDVFNARTMKEADAVANNWHINMPLEIEGEIDPRSVSFGGVPKGQRAVYFNALKRLAKPK